MAHTDAETEAGSFAGTFREGVVDVLPVAAGIIPFGLVVGATSVEAGIGFEGAMATSTIIFAGASQLAAIELLGRDAPLLVVVATVAVINLRMTMYSASLSPLLAREPLHRRLAGAYVLTDQAFALTVGRAARDGTGRQGDRRHFAYYLGAALGLWVPWQIDTAVGALVGASIPAWLPLSATIPLVFLVLLVPAVTDRATVAAAVVAGVVATLGAGLPANAGLLLGASTGIAAGSLVALRADPDGAAAPAEEPRGGGGRRGGGGAS